MKTPCFPALLLLPLLLLLPSCDSAKEKLLNLLDEKIEETGGEANTPEHAGSQEAVRQITGQDDFEAFTQLEGHVVVVDFYADWCPPCRQLSPILEGIAKSNDKVLLGKVDVDADENKPLASSKKVDGIPDVRIYVNGSKVDGFVGAPSAEVAKSRIERQIEHIQASAPAEAEAAEELAKPAPMPQVPEPPAPKSGEDNKPKPEAKPENPVDQKEPTIKPAEKDWLPPGVERK
ncbi:MAG: thioredoxin family protein [Akkermansiaceae bacterium]|nr:thioredoxin family protein [Akkermansiaceae bacterium]